MAKFKKLVVLTQLQLSTSIILVMSVIFTEFMRRFIAVSLRGILSKVVSRPEARNTGQWSSVATLLFLHFDAR